MLRVDNLCAIVAGKPNLQALSLEVKAGKVLRQRPMEFAVEAQRLLGISVERSDG
jgi:hypothetical protein